MWDTQEEGEKEEEEGAEKMAKKARDKPSYQTLAAGARR